MTREQIKRHPRLSAAFMAGKWASARAHWMKDARVSPPSEKRICVTFARLAHREYLRYLAAV